VNVCPAHLEAKTDGIVDANGRMYGRSYTYNYNIPVNPEPQHHFVYRTFESKERLAVLGDGSHLKPGWAAYNPSTGLPWCPPDM